MVNVLWFRNDLRLRDNENLYKILKNKKPVIALYCYDNSQYTTNIYGFKKTNKFRAKFLIETVNNLKEQLLFFNIRLLTFKGNTEEVFEELSKTISIESVYFQEEWTREEHIIETKVKQKLPSTNFYTSYSQFLIKPEDVFSIFKSVPNSFTSFRKKIEKYIDIRKEFTYDLSKINLGIDFSNITDNNITLQKLGFEEFVIDSRTCFPFNGGEQEGLNRIEDYLYKTKNVSYYKETRNGLIGLNYSTKFSSWLANGSISSVTIYHKIKKYEQEFEANQSTYWVIFELLWRDFFKFISLKFNENIFLGGGIQKKNTNLLVNKELIKQWINGQTRCEFVNANMIELKETGWMSNRGRQNVASYFSKTLFQDWRVGASYFESMLIDYDVHSNYGNWMYVSGVGNDTRDNKFNTTLQADRYDPDRKFRELWL